MKTATATAPSPVPRPKRRFDKTRIAMFLTALPLCFIVFAFYYAPLFGWTYAFVHYRPAFRCQIPNLSD